MTNKKRDSVTHIVQGGQKSRWCIGFGNEIVIMSLLHFCVLNFTSTSLVYLYSNDAVVNAIISENSLYIYRIGSNTINQAIFFQIFY